MVEIDLRESSSGEVAPGSGGRFAETVAAIGCAAATLRQAGITTDWIAEGLRILLQRAADLAARAAAREPLAEQMEGLTADLAEFQALAGRAAELSRKVSEVRARIAAGEERVVAVRQEMGVSVPISRRAHPVL